MFSPYGGLISFILYLSIEYSLPHTQMFYILCSEPEHIPAPDVQKLISYFPLKLIIIAAETVSSTYTLNMFLKSPRATFSFKKYLIHLVCYEKTNLRQAE